MSWWNEYVANNLSRTNIGARFNSWFGRNTTHVRNDSGCDIAVVLTSKTDSIRGITIDKSGILKVDLKPEKEVVSSKGLIPAGKTMPFERTNHVDYLTIAMKKDDGTLTETASDVKIWANNSYRVDENGIPWTLKYDEV